MIALRATMLGIAMLALIAPVSLHESTPTPRCSPAPMLVLKAWIAHEDCLWRMRRDPAIVCGLPWGGAKP